MNTLGSVHSSCFGCSFTWKSGQFFPTSPLYLADFLSCPKFTLGDFLGALDDEEFFVVEGSGGGGVAGSQTPK